MTPRSSYVLVGVFVLMLGAAFVAGLLWLTTGGPPRDYDGYLVYMTESVSGLNVDAEVKYKGVNVGRVSELGLDPERPERVRIQLLILKGTPVKEDTVATLELQGITGIASINLSGGSSASQPLMPTAGEEYAVIPSRPSLLVRLDDTVSELLASLIRSSDSVGDLLDENNRKTITATLQSSRALTEQLSLRASELEVLLGNANSMIGRMNSAVDGLPAMLEQFETTAGALEEMAVSLAGASETLQATSLDLQTTVAQSGADIRGFTAASLPQANTLISELKITASNLRQVSESLQDDPSRVLFGGPKPKPGPGE